MPRNQPRRPRFLPTLIAFFGEGFGLVLAIFGVLGFGLVGRAAIMAGVVTILIIVVRIVVGIFSFEIDIVQDRPDNMNAAVLQALDGFAGVLASDLIELCHEDNPIRHGGQD